ncbi:NAC domain-containing protein [Drosera capensis]
MRKDNDDEIPRVKGPSRIRKMSTEVEVTNAVRASSMFPGFRLDLTDEELILYYLKNKLKGNFKIVQIIGDVDFYQFEPWDLPD